MELRKLEISDVFTVAKILSKVSRVALRQVALAVEGKLKESELGLTLIAAVFTDAESELKAWLADLCGKSTDEFLKLPAADIFDIIDQLKGKEDLRDFFARASQLVTKLTEK